MNVSRYLRKEQVCLELEATQKEGAIGELANFLRRAREVADFDTFLKDVYERENLATTAIGNGIAIPHARTDAVKDFVIAFGRSQAGVEFNSLDGKPATLLFLMGTPKKKGLGEYLKMLAHLTRLLKNEAFTRSLRKASDARAVVEAFRKVEA